VRDLRAHAADDLVAFDADEAATQRFPHCGAPVRLTAKLGCRSD
jgi:hypothetical protein